MTDDHADISYWIYPAKKDLHANHTLQIPDALLFLRQIGIPDLIPDSKNHGR